MKILVTGGCGFVGTNICLYLKKKKLNVYSLDNLYRNGSKFNQTFLKKKKIINFKVDISDGTKIKKLPKFDLIIDCCAEASVEISKDDINRVIDTNLLGTINILNKIKKDKSKLIFISSSRVNSILDLNSLIKNKRIKNQIKTKFKINENFNTEGVKSIYGLTKLSSEKFIEEYSYAFKIKYLINRCGVISGPFQFGKQDQGFISHWLWKHLNKSKLNYIGYGGYGNQVRDILHIDDFCEFIFLQIKRFNKINNNLFCLGGSSFSKISLKELTAKCEKITGNRINVGKISKTSIYDIPYFVTDNSKVFKYYKWRPKRNINKILLDTLNWLTTNKIKLEEYFK
jgi:CDP-paratose 2-epimerase